MMYVYTPPSHLAYHAPKINSVFVAPRTTVHAVTGEARLPRTDLAPSDARSLGYVSAAGSLRSLAPVPLRL